MKKKHFHKKDEALSGEIKFCSECGTALNDVDISELSADREVLKENFENCKRTGKFKGDICSKLFITNPAEFDPPEDE